MPARLGFVVASRIRLVLAFVALLVAVSPASAAKAMIAGAEMNGFGRIVLSFDSPPKASVRVSNGILIMSFSEPIAIDREKLAGEMPGYVSIARLDPDGRGLRLAMVQSIRPNVMEAGERLFVDLLPESWSGMKPGLPQEVVDALARRAREAEATLKTRLSERVKEEPKDIAFRVGTLPTMTRLVLVPPKSVPINFVRNGMRAEVTFAAGLNLDKTKLKAALPPAVSAIETTSGPSSLSLVLTLKPGTEVIGFREDDSYVLDIVKPDQPQTSSAEPFARQVEAAVEKTKSEPMMREPQVAALAPQLAREPVAETGPGEQQPSAPAVEPAALTAVTHKPLVASATAIAPLPPANTTTEASARGARIDFRFKTRMAAAAFERNGVITLVFDGPEEVDPAPLAAWSGLDGSVEVTRRGPATALRFTPKARALMRLTPHQKGWTLTLGESPAAPSAPLGFERVVAARGRLAIEAPITGVSGVHWFDDPTGERIAVATASAPARGFPKPQSFVEFETLASAHGLAVVAKADDLSVSPDIDKVVIGRGGGLSLSPLVDEEGSPLGGGTAFVVDRDTWAADRAGVVRDKVWEAAAEAAATRPSRKHHARLAYARLLIANSLAAEAEGVLAAIAGDDPQAAAERPIALLRAMVAYELHRDKDARAFLALPSLADDPEAILWQATLDARAEHGPQALAGFKRVADVVDAYPDDLQAKLRAHWVRAAIAAENIGVATRELDMLAQLPGAAPANVALLKARVDEVSGRDKDALAGYSAVAASNERPLAAEALLRGTSLALKTKAIESEEALARFERLSVIWRGDAIEAETLGHLGRLYVEAGEWRQAFLVARRANEVFTDHPTTQALNDEASGKFEDLFLTGEGDQLGKLQALALYYDFKEFTPIGRRGDEIIRSLADRLVELDLIEQAGDLLQHQVDNRLHGAARATVAAKLATLRLMDGKPAQAIGVLHDTRLPELPAEVKRGRLLLEVRALSDLSRTDLALEILAGETGPEIDRLRADVLWQARRWREAGEAHERMLGDAWQDRATLADQQRTDVMRAGIAYSLAGETLSLDRLRGKYAAKMADSADARTFAFLTGPGAADTRTFRDIAKAAASADTLSDFLAEYRKRYPATAVAARPRGTRPTEPRPDGEALARAGAPRG